MPPNEIVLWSTIVSIIVTVMGAIVTNLIAIYRAGAERKKTNADSASAMADAAESIASGSKTSNDLLLERLNEFDARDKDREKQFLELQTKFDQMRIELNEWQDWARRLAHQVKSLGHEPVAFKPVKEVKDL